MVAAQKVSYVFSLFSRTRVLPGKPDLPTQ